MLARGTPVQRALEVWGALEGSGPMFQGSSWIPCGRRAADGSRVWKEARDPLASSRACGRLGVTGELGTGRPGAPQSQPFAPTSRSTCGGGRTQEPSRTCCMGGLKRPPKTHHMGGGACGALSSLQLKALSL